MKKITLEWLKEVNACSDGVVWWENQKEDDEIKVLKKLIKEDELDWANWTISRLLSKENKIRYAIYAAESVLDNFEKDFPEDKRPRNAIESALNYLNNPTEINRQSAESAARSATRSAESAAWSAARSAAWSATRSAESAARSATRSAESAAWSAARSAAWSATRSAESAARSATWSAESAAWSAAWSATRSAESAAKIKIIKYGIKLLEGE